nr:reverse transcriptase domain-containing protein [Tanacetum cinerariifolium]
MPYTAYTWTEAPRWRGCRALYKSMDGFYDSEFIVTVQRIVTICSTILTPTECATIAAIPKDSVKKAKTLHGNFKVAIHLDFLDQEINIEGTTEKQRQVPERTMAIQVEDCYPLPEINWKVESLSDYLFKCFVDAYKGYHQIQMAEQDKEKMSQ